MIIGKIVVKAQYIPTLELVKTNICFEDWEASIYYCWNFKNTDGELLAGKCLPISKRTINTDAFEFVIQHAKYSIEHCRVNRQKIFEVQEIEKL
ncbi:MAG: hypothetical protein IPP72_05550 [Chitinophagaceae bacterium]|nr:hypothetical protein [Chitinophagaceae bacterium]